MDADLFPAAPTRKSRAAAAIGWGGLIAGILDISSAFVLWGMKGASPTRVLQGVARGLLGRESFNGGMATAALGLALHFFIAFSAAAVFYVASRRLLFLTERPVIAGLLYGVVVQSVMNCVVLPLSAANPTHTIPSVLTQTVVHMLFVGLPISLATRRFAGNPAPAR